MSGCCVPGMWHTSTSYPMLGCHVGCMRMSVDCEESTRSLRVIYGYGDCTQTGSCYYGDNAILHFVFSEETIRIVSNRLMRKALAIKRSRQPS